MKNAGFFACLAMCFSVGAQDFSLQICPVFAHEKIVLEQPLHTSTGDTLTLSTLKFYLGNFGFWKNGQVVHTENAHRLLDLEDETTLRLTFDFPENTAFDSIAFDLGVDSLTTASGAMGGDLDPTRGMFWTWQSGYINLKLEGFSSKCPARGGLFELHLGGYLPPFQSVRRVVLPFSKKENARLDFDLNPLFRQIDWEKKSGIMSPGAEAVRLTNVLATSFLSHEK